MIVSEVPIVDLDSISECTLVKTIVTVVFAGDFLYEIVERTDMVSVAAKMGVSVGIFDDI